MKIKYLAFIIILIVISCSSVNNKENVENIRLENESDITEIISNKNITTEEIDVITMYIESEFHGYTFAFGIDSNTIRREYLRSFPDSIKSINSLPLRYIPSEIYLSKEAIVYLSEYIIKHCDTVIYEFFYKGNNPTFFIDVYANNGIFTCVYGSPKREIEYFQSMILWIKQYPKKEEFEKVISLLESFIENIQKVLEEQNNSKL